MKFENTQTMNFEGAFRGLRNPLESWEKSDSYFGIAPGEYYDGEYSIASAYCDYDGLTYTSDNPDEEQEYYNKEEEYASWLRDNGFIRYDNTFDILEYAFIGPKDLDLAHRMIKAGSSDRKFLRQILVSVDVTAPLYWWKEMDQYKVGTVTNSTSTMHRLASTPITRECFEMDDYEPKLFVSYGPAFQPDNLVKDCWTSIIDTCEILRQKYNETKDKRYWKELVRLLPEGWLQTRTITMNYEILRNIYAQRKSHKLTEWHQFCEWIKTLPYQEDLITFELD